jgi:hypothetical protein
MRLILVKASFSRIMLIPLIIAIKRSSKVYKIFVFYIKDTI